jgi:hypothetical protein
MLDDENLRHRLGRDMVEMMEEKIDDVLSHSGPEPQGRPVPPESAQRLAVRGIVFELMQRALQDVRPSAGRTIEVLDLLRLVSRHERVRTFLSRCGRCYVAGLYPETVVMACSAIEQQLERIADDDTVRRLLSLGPSDKITLGRRLGACKRIGILSREDYTELTQAVNIRNDIIHLAPTAGASPEVAYAILGLCQRLLVRLESLERH